MMASEQERVKTLLVDTVTLLCKNSLQFELELCVEGLLGVKVDQRDVFFLHISENFKAANGASSTTNEPSTTNKLTTSRHVSEEKNSQFTMGDVSTGVLAQKHSHRETVKMEQTISEGNGVEEVDLQYPGEVARSVPLIAGQRRVPRKASSPHRNLSAISTDVSDSDCPSSSGADLSGSEEPQRTFDQFYQGKQQEYHSRLASDSDTQPSDSKKPRFDTTERQTDNGTLSGLGTQDQKGTPWPMIAGQLGLPTQPTPYIEAEGPCNIVNDISQPGCSTWTAPSHSNPTQQMDLVIPQPPPPHFMLAMPATAALPTPGNSTVDTNHILTPPRYTPTSVVGLGTGSRKARSGGSRIIGTGLAATRKRRREWCGKWFNCDLCRYQTRRLWNLQRHTRKHVHRQTTPVHCPLCTTTDAVFVSDTDLQHHLEYSHPTNKSGDSQAFADHLVLDLTEEHMALIKDVARDAAVANNGSCG